MAEKREAFQAGVVVTGRFVADRQAELRRVTEAMKGSERLIVWGDRRQGKTTIVHKAAEGFRRRGHVVVWLRAWGLVDLEEFAQRLTAAIPTMWLDSTQILEFVKTVGSGFSLGVDASGHPELRWANPGRRLSEHDAKRVVSDTLTGLDRMAGRSKKRVCVVIDEFQELERLTKNGGAFLRSITQETSNLGYVLTGSVWTIVEELISGKGAFFNTRTLHVGPIDPEYLGRWIDSFMESENAHPEPGVGSAIIERSGPITEYIMLHAMRVKRIGQARGKADEKAVQAAFEEIVNGYDNEFQTVWNALAANQKRMLIGIATGVEQLTSTEFLRSSGVEASGSAYTALKSLAGMARISANAPYRILNPFFAEWIRRLYADG